MTPYVLGLALTTLFTVGVGIVALICLSWEGDPPASVSPTTTSDLLYPVVRRVNTDTIETVDDSGQVQRWTRS